MTKSEVVVVDYDLAWPIHFEKIKAHLLPCLSSYEIDIQHVGSTAVPGLAAKPVIDIDIIVEKAGDIDDLVEAIKDIGYEHLGDLGIEGREAFKRIDNQGDTPWYRHNLYLGLRQSTGIQNHLRFRDFLRREPDVAAAYGNLKQQLAKAYAFDRALYTEKKSDFILKVLSNLGFKEELLNDIRNQNKA